MKKLILLYIHFSFIWLHNGNVQAQKTAIKPSSVIISVKAVEYDNTAFDALRKAIKGNIKATKVNPGFADDMATITLQYEGSATELWDDLPQNIKQLFKISSINNSKISLQLKQNSTSTTTATITKEDCIDCYYYKACSFDTSLLFNGHTY